MDYDFVTGEAGMKMRNVLTVGICLLLVLAWSALAAAEQKEDPLAAWKPKFDPSGAQYT